MVPETSKILLICRDFATDAVLHINKDEAVEEYPIGNEIAIGLLPPERLRFHLSGVGLWSRISPERADSSDSA